MNLYLEYLVRRVRSEQGDADIGWLVYLVIGVVALYLVFSWIGNMMAEAINQAFSY